MKQRRINVLTVLLSLRRLFVFSGLLASAAVSAQDDLRLNDLEYFERQGVNVLVFSQSDAPQ